MNTLDDRITQFENMAAEDPDNDMAHFSLGNAYLQAGRPADAAERFLRVIELNEQMSKAYQLAGRALIDAGREAEATGLLKTGYEVAARRGEALPQREIAAMLETLGEPVPEVDAAKQAPETAGGFVCRVTGRPGTRLETPPMRGGVGEWIRDNVSAETWRAWIGQGTKVINELHLDFSREEDQRVYDEHMCEFLGIDRELFEKLSGA